MRGLARVALALVLGSCVHATQAPPGPSPAPTPPQTPPQTPASPPTQVMRERALGGVMGSTLEIRAIGSDAAALDVALDAAVAEMRRVEDLMTDWRPSPLEDLNAAAGQGPKLVPREIADVVQLSLEVSALTDGAFDITFASVGKLWDFKAKPPRIPADEDIARALEFVGYARVKVDLKASTVDLPKGMRLGLGGIAQGYGADCAMAVLMSHGVQNAIVNVSGDLKVLGTKFGKPWEIAIVHPRDKERVIAVVPLSNTCLETSGDYERCFVLDGKRYHHILDPHTGRPSEGCMSATVIAPDAALADALGTGLCVMGWEKGLELVEKLPRVEALLVDMTGVVHASSGLCQRLR